jgi:hypothetical protein
MRFLWLDINSSFSHSSLAIPSLDAQLESSLRDKADWKIISGSLSTDSSAIISQICLEQPDILFSTIWLFNSFYILSVIKKVKALLPNLRIVLGGPEFLGDNQVFLSINKEVDAVIRGEGEEIYPTLVDNLIKNETISRLPGVCTFSDGSYCDNEKAIVSNFSALKIPESSSFFSYNKPFVQIETSRGCFNLCRFCVSGSKEIVSYAGYDTIKDRLTNFKNKGVKNIRILDRTFNANTKHAINLLRIMKEFSGELKFHIEIHPAYLSEQLKSELSDIPPNLIHSEAGIQSLDPKVLKIANRKGSPKLSIQGLIFLRSLKSIEIHADLIAGLPGYSLKKLFEDYSDLIKIGVDEIQVELLKVLPGTEFRNNSTLFNLKYSPIPPYEVLETELFSFEDIITATKLSRISDLWYNDIRWRGVLQEIINEENGFLVEFVDYTYDLNLKFSNPEKCGLILYKFCDTRYSKYTSIVSNAWILAGYSINKEPGKMVKQWTHSSEIPYSPLKEVDFFKESYYYLESSLYYYFYSFSKKSKSLIAYTSISKVTNNVTESKEFI